MTPLILNPFYENPSSRAKQEIIAGRNLTESELRQHSHTGQRLNASDKVNTKTCDTQCRLDILAPTVYQ